MHYKINLYKVYSISEFLNCIYKIFLRDVAKNLHTFHPHYQTVTATRLGGTIEDFVFSTIVSPLRGLVGVMEFASATILSPLCWLTFSLFFCLNCFNFFNYFC